MDDYTRTLPLITLIELIRRGSKLSRYTGLVRTTISLPDDLIRSAQAAARQLRMSRSRFFAIAISEFLGRHRTNRITQRLNEVYSEQRAKLNPALHSAQLGHTESDSW
jgi:metal-responsive CopG/Arc/MetJ family transcriptional regulator